jgi:DDE superfamily endonuclease
VQRSPRLVGIDQSRWTLAALRDRCVWLCWVSLGGVCKVLKRLGITYKRGRRYLHSPDPAYDQKMAAIAAARAEAEGKPEKVIFLYQDELTYYRRATVAQGYAVAGSDGPRADQGYGSNKKRRIAGCLNAVTGALFAWQRAGFDRETLIRFYKAVEAAYPTAELIYLAQDNWPVHDHPDVQKYLTTSRIRVLFLPTYAPWTNPSEKVWRKLYQEVLHQHDLKDRWEELTALVQAWLERHAGASPALLHYVGLR